MEWKQKLLDLEHKKNLDLKQNVRIHWVVEGEENSRFFHGIIKSNISNNRIHGLSVNGVWFTDPTSIKNEVILFFKENFSEKMDARPILECDFPNTLSDSDASLLIEPFNLLEVKAAVWSYGNERVPGPDDISFKFLKSYYLGYF